MTSHQFEDGLLQQEVEELTDLLRNDEILADLRALLVKAGHEPTIVLLAGFLENAEGFQGGVIVTSEREVYEFERDVSQTDSFQRWEKVDNISALLDTYPAVLIALDNA